jgi:hypothetical protein
MINPASIALTSYEAAQNGQLARTVFNRPRDFPDAFVARMFVVSNGATRATDHIALFK